MALIHSSTLALLNLAGVLVGFAVYHLSGVDHQIAVQVPVAALFTVAGFVAWLRMTRRTRIGWGRTGTRQRVMVFLLALVWAAVIFVPLHFFTQGYLSAWSNVTALWAFQAPANLLALLAARCGVGSAMGLPAE